MVLEDASIIKMTQEKFKKVYDPKVIGAQNLIKPFKPNDLDFILFFSSISSIIGNQDQINYAAGNSFLDSYAQHLSLLGFRSYVVNLGAVDNVGVIATDFQLRKIMQLRETQNKQFTTIQVFNVINSILRTKIIVQHIPSFDLLTLCKTFSFINEKCGHLIQRQVESNSKGTKETLSISALKLMIGKILQMDGNSINEKEKLTSYGVDSLLAVEISSLLSSKFSIQVSQMDILSGATLNSFLINNSGISINSALAKK